MKTAPWSNPGAVFSFVALACSKRKAMTMKKATPAASPEDTCQKNADTN
ncbi:MAG: hypothetical protein V4723_20090 [Pseudomonadota bacterium]